MLSKDEWKELEKLLAKYRIPYGVTYNDTSKTITINPVKVAMFDEEPSSYGSVSLIDGHIDFAESEV